MLGAVHYDPHRVLSDARRVSDAEAALRLRRVRVFNLDDDRVAALILYGEGRDELRGVQRLRGVWRGEAHANVNVASVGE